LFWTGEIALADSLRAAINRHRDDPAPRLNFSVALDRLMDNEYCGSLIADLAQAGIDGWEVVKATREAWRTIPARPGLYMFVWEPKFQLPLAREGLAFAKFPIVLYIGRAGDGKSTNTLKKRYRDEYSRFVETDPEILWSPGGATTREARLAKYLSIVPMQFWYSVIDDRQTIASLEQRLFNLFTPPLNSSGGPRLRPVGKPTAAF
jgi:hypothetical protein